MSRKVIFLWICLSFAVFCNGLKRCRNPNGHNGVCQSLNTCTSLRTLQSKYPWPPETERFLQESQCVNEVGDPNNVCCSRDTEFIATTKPPYTERSSKLIFNSNLLPNLSKCGKIPLDDKILNGFETRIDDFTWMALIEYTYPTGTKDFDCAGSLINERYVLTAAHCIKTNKQKRYISSVRLGENNLATERDCDRNNVCAPPPINVGVETFIVHEGYKDDIYTNDIALIRLDRNVKSTPFIQPICLPGIGNLERSPVGTNLTVAGWGYTESGFSPNGKLQVDVPVFDQIECAHIYRDYFTLTDDQLCAGGFGNMDSCQGDSGGPLMRMKNGKLFLEGIVSLGLRCGTHPGIYTRVANYEDWINSNIRP